MNFEKSKRAFNMNMNMNIGFVSGIKYFSKIVLGLVNSITLLTLNTRWGLNFLRMFILKLIINPFQKTKYSLKLKYLLKVKTDTGPKMTLKDRVKR